MDQKLKEKLLKQFDKLIEEGKIVLNSKHLVNYYYYVKDDLFHSWKIQAINLSQCVVPSQSVLRNKIAEIINFQQKYGKAVEIQGILTGLREDLNNGMLEDLERQIEGAVSVDYLEQAESLMKEEKNRSYSYIPVAVLAGVVLEKNLKTLCEKNIPPIPTVKDNGFSKTMGALIDDLKAAGIFNEIRAKQLRGYADIRNAAAHGRNNEFSREQVQEMLFGITNFLAEFMK